MSWIVGNAGRSLIGVPLGALAATVAASAARAAGYVGAVTGAVTVDLGVVSARRHIGLGPQQVEIAAPRDVVFDVIANAYTGRRPRAVPDKIRVLAAWSDLVLAAHRTPIRDGWSPPLPRRSVSPRPNVSISGWFAARCLMPSNSSRSRASTRAQLSYHGELGADLWWIGQKWATAKASRWERTVADSLASVTAEAERKAAISRWPPIHSA